MRSEDFRNTPTYRQWLGMGNRATSGGEEMKIVLGLIVFVLVVFFIISFAFLSAEEFGEDI